MSGNAEQPFSCLLALSCFVFMLYNIVGNNIISHVHKCTYWTPYGINLYQLSLENCKKECSLRHRCYAMNYFRRQQKCTLLLEDDDIYDTKEYRTCVHVRKEDMKHITLSNYSRNVQCDPGNMTYDAKECSSIGKVQNVVVKGNINQIGSRLKIYCTSGYTPRTERITTTIECLPSGDWSHLPECYKVTFGGFCKEDIDCVETGSVCIKHTCFCGSLYRYNITLKDCFKVCNKMTDGFTEYPSVRVRGYNLQQSKSTDCRTMCNMNSACLSYELSNHYLYLCTLGQITYGMAKDGTHVKMRYTTRSEKLFSRNCE